MEQRHLMTLTRALPAPVFACAIIIACGTDAMGESRRSDPYAYAPAAKAGETVVRPPESAPARKAGGPESTSKKADAAKKSDTAKKAEAESKAGKALEPGKSAKAAKNSEAPKAADTAKAVAPAAVVDQTADSAKVADPKAAEATPPAPPEGWTDTEIAAAKLQCDVLLKGIDLVVAPEPPVRAGACGTPAPVRLTSIGKGASEVSFSPPPVLTCDMVKALSDWFKGDLQALAKAYLGSPVVRIETMSSYSCRNAYGRRTTRLSEHGLANALDVGAFVTASAVTARVLGTWGPTQRDIRAQAIAAAKAAEAKAAAQRAAAAAAGSAAPAPAPAPAPVMAAPKAPDLGLRFPRSLGGEGFGIAPNRLGGPSEKAKEQPKAEAKAPDVAVPSQPKVEPLSREQRFLRAAHGSACKYFGTVLGPEANTDHVNHFHLDMAPRKTGNFCE